MSSWSIDRRKLVGKVLTRACVTGIVLMVPGCGSQANQDVRQARELALAAEHRGDCAGAVAQWDVVLSQDGADLSARRHDATCLTSLGQLARAMEELQFVADRDGTSASYQELAQIQWRVGYVADARQSLVTAGKRAHDPFTMRSIAEALTLDGDPTSAIALLDRLPQEDHDYVYYSDIAAAESQLGMTREFEADFRRAIDTAPVGARAGLDVRLGDARWLMGDYAGANDAYKAATSAPGLDQTHLYSMIADCDMHLDQLAPAIEAYNRAISVTTDPARADTRDVLVLDLARAELRLGQTNEAKASLEALLDRPGVEQSVRVEAQMMLKGIA